MDDYIDSISSLFQDHTERQFTDRDEIIQILDNALIMQNEDPTIFQLIIIHGIGGTGKTRLITEFKNRISPEALLCVSFEIEKRLDLINNLILIRKELPGACPFFDYALLRYWEMTNPARINDDFMKLLHENFFTDFLDAVAEITGSASSVAQLGVGIPAIPSPSAIMNFINSIYRKVPQIAHHKVIKLIANSSSDTLYESLPALLGIEIRRKIEKNDICLPLFAFDSYQQSQPYSNSAEWLLQLIKAIGQGLFIVTSREKIQWDISSQELVYYHMEFYPEDDARELLETVIIERPDIINTIIKSTQCLPLYIDLALSIYEKEKSITEERLIQTALFSDHRKLVRHFINHLNPKWQTAILDLAVVSIFNQEIFSHFAQTGMLKCAAYEFTAIINSDLINYLSVGKRSNLYKLHDVFCRDVQSERNVAEFYSIFSCYLEYICFRRDHIIQENNGATLTVLFQNIIHLAIVLEEKIEDRRLTTDMGSVPSLNTSDLEKILDIFFTLDSYRICFDFKYPTANVPLMGNICRFVYAKVNEKKNTNATIKMLEDIPNVACFGKHKLSYYAVLYYSKSLTGQYFELKNWIDEIDRDLTDAEKCEWYYNRIKVYQADCEMLNGQFFNALQSLTLLDNGFQTENDRYSIQRTIGHIYRFNMDLDRARNKYASLKKDYYKNNVYREYIFTNIAECDCYFPQNSFIKRVKKQLGIMNAPYNVKNRGKLLCALAIACTVKRRFGTAQSSIDESIRIFGADGYQSGKLFSYMAQAFLDYAKNGKVSSRTEQEINFLMCKNGAYMFFNLPLAILKNDEQAIQKIKEQYGWLDFSQTENTYRRFISQLQ